MTFPIFSAHFHHCKSFSHILVLSSQWSQHVHISIYCYNLVGTTIYSLLYDSYNCLVTCFFSSLFFSLPKVNSAQRAQFTHFHKSPSKQKWTTTMRTSVCYIPERIYGSIIGSYSVFTAVLLMFHAVEVIVSPQDLDLLIIPGRYCSINLLFFKVSKVRFEIFSHTCMDRRCFRSHHIFAAIHFVCATVLRSL